MGAGSEAGVPGELLARGLAVLDPESSVGVMGGREHRCGAQRVTGAWDVHLGCPSGTRT